MSAGSAPSGPETQISRGIVAIYKDHLGRGPDSARTTITEDFVTTILHGSLTKAELVLIETHDEEMVRTMRRRFQSAMSKDTRALIEETTGRRTVAFLSDHNVVDDIAIETVIFEGREPGNSST